MKDSFKEKVEAILGSIKFKENKKIVSVVYKAVLQAYEQGRLDGIKQAEDVAYDYCPADFGLNYKVREAIRRLKDS